MANYVVDNELRREPVTPVMVRWMCPQTDCGGEMTPTGVVLTSHPAQYPHRCNKCDYEARSYQTFPHLEYEPATPPIKPSIARDDDADAPAVSVPSPHKASTG